MLATTAKCLVKTLDFSSHRNEENLFPGVLKNQKLFPVLKKEVRILKKCKN